VQLHVAPLASAALLTGRPRHDLTTARPIQRGKWSQPDHEAVRRAANISTATARRGARGGTRAARECLQRSR
jgi:hypothetical protein